VLLLEEVAPTSLVEVRELVVLLMIFDLGGTALRRSPCFGILDSSTGMLRRMEHEVAREQMNCNPTKLVAREKCCQNSTFVRNNDLILD
jgi:hypothetical protein